MKELDARRIAELEGALNSAMKIIAHKDQLIALAKDEHGATILRAEAAEAQLKEWQLERVGEGLQRTQKELTQLFSAFDASSPASCTPEPRPLCHGSPSQQRACEEYAQYDPPVESVRCKPGLLMKYRFVRGCEKCSR